MVNITEAQHTWPSIKNIMKYQVVITELIIPLIWRDLKDDH
jgi:hypothetical protein